MAVFNIPFNEEFRSMVIEVMQHVRRQQYTPELLCEHQRVLDCMHFYWWSMDMKKEEYATEFFDDDFQYWNGRPGTTDKRKQALTSKWVNKSMQTMHMGHQPLIWFQDENHARGIFQYEDHMCYFDDASVCEGWAVYCDDFVKRDGTWYISRHRMAYRQMDGTYKNPFPPKDWEPEEWDEPNY